MKSILTFFFCFYATFLSAQMNNEDKINYDNEYTFGAQIYNKGIGIDFKLANFNTIRKATFYHAQLMTIRDPKEVKISNSAQDQSGVYTYNKINQAFALNLGYGFRYYLAPKLTNSDAAVSLNISGGLSLTFLKPIYVNVLDYSSGSNPAGNIKSQKITENNAPLQSDILGNSQFSKGLNELSTYTGLYTKVGLNVDWSDYMENIKSIEVGFIINAFSSNLPLIRKYENKSVYSTFYIAFSIGDKY